MEIKDRPYIVYKHSSPDGRIYIGITGQKNPKKRWQGGTGYRGNSYFTRAIKKYGWENFSHEILNTGLTEDQAKDLEIKYISQYKSNIRKYGFNISSGGESKKGTTISEWHKKRISEASKGKIVSEETRIKLSNASKNTWNDPEFVNHMRNINLGKLNPQYGKVRTDEEKIKRGAKRILQKDMEGNVINEYISLHEASNKTQIARSSISKCCKNIFKQAGGFLWEFV